MMISNSLDTWMGESSENSWRKAFPLQTKSKPSQSKAEQHPRGTTVTQLNSNQNLYSNQMGNITSIFFNLDKMETH